MSGHYSRNKGKRNEYVLRDSLREEGYTADRVPSSGAAQGFKGDVKFVDKDGTVRIAELKAYADRFTFVYDLMHDASAYTLYTDTYTVSIHRTMRDALRSWPEPLDRRVLPTHDMLCRAEKRLLKLQELLKGCDVLVVKNDRRPFLYIRYVEIKRDGTDQVQVSP